MFINFSFRECKMGYQKNQEIAEGESNSKEKQHRAQSRGQGGKRYNAKVGMLSNQPILGHDEEVRKF